MLDDPARSQRRDVTLFVERLLEPAERGRLLDQLEAEVRRTAAVASPTKKTIDMQRLVFRADAMRAIMRHAIEAQELKAPQQRQALADLADEVSARLRQVRDDLARQLSGRERAETDAMSSRMVALQMLREYVAALPSRVDWSVAQIDAEMADILAPPPFDWGPMQALADAVRHQGVYVLAEMRQRAVRAESLHIPDVGERLANNSRAIEALARLGADPALSRLLVSAIRHGDVPRVRFVE